MRGYVECVGGHSHGGRRKGGRLPVGSQAPHRGMVSLKDSGGGVGWCSGKVHGPQRVVVNLHRLRQSLGVPTVTLTRDMASLPTTVRTERHRIQ